MYIKWIKTVRNWSDRFLDSILGEEYVGKCVLAYRVNSKEILVNCDF
jgi:hypothetical protein